MDLCINVEEEEEEVFQDRGLFTKSQVKQIIYMILFKTIILSMFI